MTSLCAIVYILVMVFMRTAKLVGGYRCLLSNQLIRVGRRVSYQSQHQLQYRYLSGTGTQRHVTVAPAGHDDVVEGSETLDDLVIRDVDDSDDIEVEVEDVHSLSKVEAGHVYFVATPIGNLQDITSRAKETLSDVDVVCAEDTRKTKSLFKLLGIRYKDMVSHHEHNWKEQIPKLIDMAKKGRSLAVVSDAGSPGISDPGAQLADACFRAGIAVHPIPGASAVASALSICGFPSTSFAFFGFLAVKGKERKQQIDSIAAWPYTAVFFEAPHRVKSTFADLCSDPNIARRSCLCCREMTKMHEEMVRGTVQECKDWLDSFETEKNSKRIKGEFTIVLGSPPTDSSDGASAEEELTAALEKMRDDGVKRSEAVKLVTTMLKLPKSIVYKTALDMKW